MLNIDKRSLFATLAIVCFAAMAVGSACADDGNESTPALSTKRKPLRLLLIGQGPDGHPYATHEFMPAMNLLAKLLNGTPGLQTILVKADEPWKQGPELIDGSDGIVLFVSQGARWIHQDPARLAALQKLAARGGGLVTIHWGMGCREARYIDEFVKIFGGCHGGPDRRYKIVQVRTEFAQQDHPIVHGIEPFDVKDEFYYTLKFAKPAGSVTPLIRVPIEESSHTVCWAWQRPDGGRSFGFSGCHFHRNWELEQYRRLVAQGVLWSLDKPIPTAGLPVEVSEVDLQLPPDPKK